MKIELGTESFRRAVSKVVKTGDAGILLTTTIIGIEGKDGNVYLTGTDKSTNIKVTLKNVIQKDAEFYTNTNAELLKKLLDRTQSATVLLDIYDNRIVFSGNGDANLEIVYNNEDGANTLLRIPEIQVNGEGTKVRVTDLEKFSTYLKNTLGNNIATPQYMNYRVFKNKAMTYNTFGLNLVELDWDTDLMIPSSIADLFSTLEGEYAIITVDGNKIKVATDDVEITGMLPTNLEDYPTTNFVNLVYSEKLFGKVTIIDKMRFLGALDRISLFISKNDNNIFTAEIGDKDMVLITFSKNCIEKVVFDSSENDTVLSVNLSIELLEKALSSIKTDKVVLSFGAKGVRIYDEKDKAYLVVPYAVEKK